MEELMRGSGAEGLVAIPIAGVILLILKIFRIKHNSTYGDGRVGPCIPARWDRAGGAPILPLYRAWCLSPAKSALTTENLGNRR